MDRVAPDAFIRAAHLELGLQAVGSEQARSNLELSAVGRFSAWAARFASRGGPMGSPPRGLAT